MKWQPDMITQPLLISSNIIPNECVKLFKHLQSYMGDKKTSKPSSKHAIKNISKCLKLAGGIYDEAYIQVLKQITDNPDSEKRNKGWNFLAILASSFAPETKLYYCLLNYLREQIKENPDQEIVKRSNFIIIRLYNTYNSRRKFALTAEEVKHIEEMKPMYLRIYFFSGTYTSVPYECYTTLNEIKYFMMMKLKLKVGRIPYYGLCEILDKPESTEERIIDEEDKVVDMMAMWEHDKLKFSEKKINAEFKLYLKLLIHYGSTETDIDTITLNFYQALYDVIQGKYSLIEDDLLKLGAIQIIAIYGILSHEVAKEKIETEINTFVPYNKLVKLPESYWVKGIMEEYTKLQKIDTKFDARMIYLDHVSKNNFYESHLFWVKVKLENENPIKEKKNENSDLRLLAIKPNGVSICDVNKYVDIYHWGYNMNTFVIVLQTEPEKFAKYYFETYQVRTIFVIVQSYCHLIAQIGLHGLNEYLKNYVSNFKNLPKSIGDEKVKLEGLRSLFSTVFKK